MKRLRIIIAIVAAFLFLLWSLERSLSERPSSAARVAPTNSTIQPTTQSERHTEPPLVDSIQRGLRIRQDLKLLNTQPIAYYGLTVDETGAPLSNVKVDFDINVGSGAKPISGTVTSDQNGRFEITGYEGMRLWINPQKEGFRIAASGGSGNFSLLYPVAERYQGSLSNRTVIRMWKLKGAEDLVIINQDYPIPPGSAGFLTIDLLSAKIVDKGGDLRVTVSRTELDDRRSFDWTYSIVPVDGGIMAVPSDEIYNVLAAPVDGYQLQFDNEFSNARSKRLPNDQQSFFLKSRNGQVHSKFIFGIDPPKPDKPGRITFRKGVANPNSSPNWEEDPMKMRLP